MEKWHRSWMAATLLAVVFGCKAQAPADDVNVPEQPRGSDRAESAAKPANSGSSWKDAGESAPIAPQIAGSGTAGSRSHVVKKGDTMFSLARLYYKGDVHKWHAIFDANRDRIPDPNQLKVGQVLVIPD